jgi:3-oxoacyl-[acyl-carrier-protein] synthase II
VVGYDVVTPLGPSLEATWGEAERGAPRFEIAANCEPFGLRVPVGLLRGYDPRAYAFGTEKELANWNAAFVLLTMAVCERAVAAAGVDLAGELGPRTACLMGSALNGHEAFRSPPEHRHPRYPRQPLPLPTCAQRAGSKACAWLGFTCPTSPGRGVRVRQHAIALGARLIRDCESTSRSWAGSNADRPEIVFGLPT